MTQEVPAGGLWCGRCLLGESQEVWGGSEPSYVPGPLQDFVRTGHRF